MVWNTEISADLFYYITVEQGNILRIDLTSKINCYFPRRKFPDKLLKTTFKTFN